ncbi:hypothetical protein [Pontibacter cellulosilyticus]|uniref:Uncharacterized protein n=1 Tax=Pontibacter cellulosilyticus TaxID=1720253 RepID=A0A923N8T2_9BACT|nr:hypothetical protein [Pontibacter cellulosilyticus]MBC5994326.1 hypothetical protein [Pontibacter cellulosilyticus]
MEFLPNIILFTVVGLYLLLLVSILAFIYFDAEQRGVNGWLIVAFTFFSGTIFGSLAWLVFRPKLKPQPIPVRS